VGRGTGEHGDDLLGEHRVVDRVREVVAARGGSVVDVQDDVGAEGLPLALLEVEDAVVPARLETDEADLVQDSTARVCHGSVRRRVHSCPPGRVVALRRTLAPLRHAAATRTASAEPATSWTRTHQAPAAAASAETAAVALSRASGGAGAPSAPASR